VSRVPGFGLPLEYDQDETEPREEAPLSVSELVGLISETLQGEYSRVLVLGELTSFKRAASGHCYFTLSDESAAVDAVMWRSDAARLRFQPSTGDEVVCRGQVSVYPKQGRMQLYVTTMRPVGAGAAQRALEELRKRLVAEGVFDIERKRPLPFLPGTIGVVTSRHGAALHDILTTIRRRYARCRVVVSAAVVQGAEAPADIVAALDRLADLGECDVAIVGRGGGAAEDLAPFNDEAVVRRVASFPVPIVSAVGHEVDYTLCDLAADVRAATPTAAAEAVVPVYAELVEDVASQELRLFGAARRHVDNLRHHVGHAAGRLRDPRALVATARQRTDELAIRLERALIQRHRVAAGHVSVLRDRVRTLGRTYVEELLRDTARLEQRMHRAVAERSQAAATRFASLHSKLDALSPLAVLDRGYSLATRDDGRIVRRASDVAPGDELELRFHAGRARTRVLETRGDD
jgi:exodeoxyribonuclease VII large subunit